MKKNELLNLFTVFFKVGLFTFGGGLAMLPIIHKEVVEKKKWIDDDEMTDIIAIAESTPGPIAVNTATFVGYKVARLSGALISTFGLVLPSLVIISLISLFLDWFLGLEYVGYAFMGIRCAVALLILSAAIKLFKKIKKTYLTYILVLIGFAATLLLPKLSSIYVILFGVFVGVIEYLIRMSILKHKEEKSNDSRTS